MENLEDQEKRYITHREQYYELLMISHQKQEDRREWKTVLKIFKKTQKTKKTFQPRILHPAKKFFKNKDEIKIFSNKQKLRESFTDRPASQDKLKFFRVKGNDTDGNSNLKEGMTSTKKVKHKMLPTVSHFHFSKRQLAA